ncbi:MAG TPA: iron-sulfur cluster assembly scaffold protein [Syntrophales bacterium]|nr:iron-sulfur cluster assembly scaffold protein [Syntrophales bacterium]
MEDEGKILEEMEAILREKAANLYPEKIFDYGKNPEYYGKMEKPDGYAERSDECGKDIKMFLRVRNGKIEESRFVAEGCIFTVAACNAAAEMSQGRSIAECLKINRSSISRHLGGMPVDHGHCALLAALLFQKALRSYIEKIKIQIKE